MNGSLSNFGSMLVPILIAFKARIIVFLLAFLFHIESKAWLIASKPVFRATSMGIDFKSSGSINE